MRTVVVATLLVAVAMGATGCASTGAAKAGAIARAPAGSSAGGSDAPGSDTCAEVRAGIDAFNQGDFDATVEHFTQAVPLAHADVVADDTQATEDLLEAVVYYAKLAPDDYLDASRSSPDFAKYKAITLGQCETGASQSEPSSPGTSV